MFKKTLLLSVIADLFANGTVVKWSTDKLTFAVSGQGKDVTKCQCTMPTGSLSLAIIDTTALKCIVAKDFIDQGCSMTITVNATSNTDTDAIACSSTPNTSFSEIVLADCGFKISKIMWDKAQIQKGGQQATKEKISEAQKIYYKDFELKESGDVCSTDYWSSTTSDPTKSQGATLSASKVASGYAATVTPDAALDPSKQWLLLGGTYSISGLPSNGVATTTVFAVTRTYDANSKSECVGNDGVPRSAWLGALAMALVSLSVLSV